MTQDDAIVSEIEIAAPPERVFKALTEEQQLILWWNDASCPITHSGLAQLPVARKDYTGGWPGVVEKLKTYIEK